MNNTHIKTKLQLWDTAGFDQFVEDLHNYFHPEMDVKFAVQTLKKLYQRELEKTTPKSKYKQGELPL